MKRKIVATNGNLCKARLKEIDKKLAVLEPKSAQLFKEQISGGI